MLYAKCNLFLQIIKSLKAFMEFTIKSNTIMQYLTKSFFKYQNYICFNKILITQFQSPCHLHNFY